MTTRPISKTPTTQAATSDPADFSDPESQRVLDAIARSLSRELGRQAAREHCAAMLAPTSKKDEQ